MALEAEIEVRPERPVLGDSFEIVVTVRSPEEGTPTVTFDPPRGLEVLGSSHGTVVEARYARGRFTRSVDHVFTHRVRALRAGTFLVTGVEAELGGRRARARNTSVRVLREARRPRRFFVRAEVSKERVYMGEGVDLAYHLYVKGDMGPVGLVGFERFPSLNNFIKRSVDIDPKGFETVDHQGMLYRRSRIYGVRIYPGKAGKIVIDPVRVKLSVPMGGGGPFGFGLSATKTVSVSSPRVEVLAMPLPSEGVPANFTGLVGEHGMAFSLNKERYVVGEVVEGRLEVEGEGLLETFEPPPLYEHGSLERFDTKSEVVETGPGRARKVFEHTFIPRAGLEVPARGMALSFFDPVAGRYYEKELELPALAASGEPPGGGGDGSSAAAASGPGGPGGADGAPPAPAPSVVGPMALDGGRLAAFVGVDAANAVLGLLAVAALLSSADLRRRSPGRRALLARKVREIRRRGATYGNLYDLLSTYHGKELPAGEIIERSPLGGEAKAYLRDLLDRVGRREFSGKGGGRPVAVEARHFKEFLS